MTLLDRNPELFLYGALLGVLALGGGFLVALARRDAPGIAWLRRATTGRHRWWAAAVEVVILLTLLFACSFGPLLSGHLMSESGDTHVVPSGSGYSRPVPVQMFVQPGERYASVSSLLPLFTPFCLLLAAWGGGIVVLSRVARRRSLFLGAALAWVLLGAWAFWWYEVWPVEKEIRLYTIPGLFEPGLLLGTVSTLVVRMLFWLLLTLLAGLYAVRRSFSYGRFLAGCVLGDLLAYWFLFPFWAQLAPVALSFLFPVFCLALILLPGQRRALERLTGLTLHPASERPALLPSPVTSLLGHMALLLTAGFVLFSAFVNHFERQQWTVFVQGPRPAYHPPALRNAYDDLKRFYIKGQSPQPDLNLSRELEPVRDLLGVTPPDRARAVWEKVPPERFRQHLDKLAPLVADYEAASRADYLETPGTQWLAFLPLREISRLLHYRAMLALHEKRPDEALRDIQSLLRMGGLLRSGPYLVYQMIGVAIPGIGLDAAHSYFLAVRGTNPGALEALSQVLRQEAGSFRAGLDADALRRGEVVLYQEIVPNGPVLMPATERALQGSWRLWARYDLLRLAVALELYHARHGSYPSSLGKLAPEFLEQIPVDPFVGKSYGYELMPDGKYRLWLNPELLGPEWSQESAEYQFPLPGTDDRETTR